jgi:hypothetical protein
MNLDSVTIELHYDHPFWHGIVDGEIVVSARHRAVAARELATYLYETRPDASAGSTQGETP